jgi:hypothetical protein
MVNDNARDQDAHIPVDLILSDMAEQAGVRVEENWGLPRGKGNRSQQMGLHGREETRKCVDVWRRWTVANPAFTDGSRPWLCRLPTRYLLDLARPGLVMYGARGTGRNLVRGAE